jgi:hypothetical protein
MIKVYYIRQGGETPEFQTRGQAIHTGGKSANGHLLGLHPGDQRRQGVRVDQDCISPSENRFQADRSGTTEWIKNHVSTLG